MNEEELVEVIAEAISPNPMARGYAKNALAALRSAGFQVLRVADAQRVDFDKLDTGPTLDDVGVCLCFPVEER